MGVMFVDKKTKKDGIEIGVTNNMECVLLNMQIISPDYAKLLVAKLEEYGDGIFDTCICGRYLTIIQLFVGQKGEMIFVDTCNDYDNALDFYNSLSKLGGNINYKDRFIKMFETLRPLYDEVFDTVELRLFSEFTNFASTKFS